MKIVTLTVLSTLLALAGCATVPPPPPAGQRVRVLIADDSAVVRGLVARWLCEADRLPRTPTHVAAVVAEHRPCALCGLLIADPS